MYRHLLLFLSIVFLHVSNVSCQGPERGITLPISAQNAVDMEFGYNGTSYISVHFDHMFFLKPERFGPALLLRAGVGNGLSSGSGMILVAEAAYTTGYLTFVELGAGYNGQMHVENYRHLPYFLAAFRYRANAGFSVRLFSRLMMHHSDEVPLFGMGISVGYTF